jgi:hypothetical protein
MSGTETPSTPSIKAKLKGKNGLTRGTFNEKTSQSFLLSEPTPL